MPIPKKSSRKHIPPNNSVNYASLKPHFWAPAGAAILALAVFTAYFPSLNGGFIWDDEALLTKNLLVKASAGLHRIWCTTDPTDYWPLTNTSFWIEWRLWDINSTGYHVANLVLHIAASLLIWTILRKLTIPGAFLAALIFALHPVNVESVAWIAQRKNTLSMLFFLFSILWYMKFNELARPRLAAKQFAARRPPSTAHCVLWYGLSLAAFMLAMLSKGSAAVLPALVLGIIWWRRSLTKQDFLRTAPFFIVAAALTLVNIWFQRSDVGEIIRNAGFVERLLGAGVVVCFYLYKALLPIDLAFIYPQWHIEADNPQWWLPLLAVLAVTAVLWWFRKGWSRPLLFAWGFFCVSLVPVMGFTDVGFMKYSLFADHYQHIAVIGVIALAAAGWSIWHQRARNAAHWTTAIAVATVGAFTFLTYLQNELYRDAVTLYQDTLVKNPECWIAYNNLGVELFQAGQFQAPIKYFEQALHLKPNYATARNNLGLALNKAGRFQEAIENYEQALSLQPKYAEARNNLGYALASAGRLQEAIEHYREVLRLKADYPVAHNNLAMALLQTGRFQEAIEHYEQALRLKPDYAEARNNLGEALARTDRPLEAIKCYEQALSLQPDFPEAQYNLGLLLLQTGRPQESIKYFEQSLKLKPDYFVTHNNLGTALLRTGRLEEAIEHYEQALKIKPDYIEAYGNLAPAYLQAHRPADAVASARKGLELAQSMGRTDMTKQFEDLLKSLGN
ncbi:MAG: tetratricopeptide repeat protein [Thermoguttaceae bacterium]|jgi:tetratricopeptide (TPR) repeat protein